MILTVELTNVLTSFTILGFIWLVTLTHYPSFKYIEDDQWQSFHKHHSRTISIIIMPLMLLELFLAIYLVWTDPSSIPWIVTLGLVIGIWLNTFQQAVPLHNKLIKQKNLKLISKLNQVNWIRTILWTIKAIVLICALVF